MGVFAAGTISKFSAQSARAMTRVHRIGNAIGGHRAKESLSFLGELMVNHAKDQHRPGAWIDRTANGRRSVTWITLDPGESVSAPYKTRTEGVQRVPIRNDTKGPMLVVFVGMTYMIYVEFMEKYDVLTGAMERYRPLAAELLGKGFKITLADALKG